MPFPPRPFSGRKPGGKARPAPVSSQLFLSAEALAAAAKRLEGLQPPPPSPRYDDILPPKAEPSGAAGVVAGVAGAAAAIVGPRKFWTGTKWVWRNVIFGATVKEGATWYVVFNIPGKVTEEAHHLTNFFLGWPSEVPVYTREYSFLERQFHGIPGPSAQRTQAINFSMLSIEELRKRIEQIEPGTLSNVAALEERLLLERILAIRLDEKAKQDRINAARRDLLIKAQQAGVAVWATWQDRLWGMSNDGQNQGDGPPGSSDP